MKIFCIYYNKIIVNFKVMEIVIPNIVDHIPHTRLRGNTRTGQSKEEEKELHLW